MSGYVYRERSQESIHRRAVAKGGDFAGYLDEQFPIYQVRDGQNWIRPLPPTWDNAEHYGYEVWVHYRVGGNTDCLCLRIMKGEKCPVCQGIARLTQQYGEETQEIKDAKAKKRVIMWVVDRFAEDTGPQIFPMAQTLDQNIVKISQDIRTGAYTLIDHPQNGHDVIFDKSGSGRNTDYGGERLDPNPSAINPAYIDYIVQHPIPSVLIWRDYQEVKALYEGGVGGDEEPSYGAGPSNGQWVSPPPDAGGWQPPAQGMPPGPGMRQPPQQQIQRRPPGGPAPGGPQRTAPAGGGGPRPPQGPRAPMGRPPQMAPAAPTPGGWQRAPSGPQRRPMTPPPQAQQPPQQYTQEEYPQQEEYPPVDPNQFDRYDPTQYQGPGTYDNSAAPPANQFPAFSGAPGSGGPAQGDGSATGAAAALRQRFQQR